MVDVQSAVPHLQSVPAVLDVNPFVTAQIVGGRRVHELELEETSQYIPVIAVQSAVPHLQSVSAVLDVNPFVTAQVVGGRLEQAFEEAAQYIPVPVPTFPSFIYRLLQFERPLEQHPVLSGSHFVVQQSHMPELIQNV